MKYFTIIITLAFVFFTNLMSAEPIFNKLEEGLRHTIPTSVKDNFNAAKLKSFLSDRDLSEYFKENIYSYFKSQKVSLVVKVVDENNNAIPGASVHVKQIREASGENFPTEVTIKRKEWSGKTNNQGICNIDNLPPVYYVTMMYYILTSTPIKPNISIDVSSNGFKPVKTEIATLNGNIVFLGKEMLLTIYNNYKSTNRKFPEINNDYDIPEMYKKDVITLVITMKINKYYEHCKPATRGGKEDPVAELKLNTKDPLQLR